MKVVCFCGVNIIIPYISMHVYYRRIRIYRSQRTVGAQWLPGALMGGKGESCDAPKSGLWRESDTWHQMTALISVERREAGRCP